MRVPSIHGGWAPFEERRRGTMSDWELEFDELNELAEKSQFKKLKAILDEKNEMDVA